MSRLREEPTILIAVIGDECGLVSRRIAETVPQLHTRPIVDVVSVVFDDAAESWLLRTGSGDEHRASVVIDTRELCVPTAPDSQRDAQFDRVGNRGGHGVRNRRWMSRASHVDAIIYATGATIKPGLPDDVLVGPRGHTIQEVWRDGAESYCGVAVHGFPNYFMLTGRDEQLRYIADCLQTMQRKGAARVEVRRSAQREFVDHARISPPARAFEFTAEREEVYDGPAMLTIDGHDHRVRVRLTGHLDPIDGKYHWRGTVSDADTELASRPVKLAVNAQADARITERTPWGSYSIAGVGAPPFDLN